MIPIEQYFSTLRETGTEICPSLGEVIRAIRDGVEVFCAIDNESNFLCFEADICDVEEFYDIQEDEEHPVAFTNTTKRLLERVRRGQFCYAETGGFMFSCSSGTSRITLLGGLPIPNLTPQRLADVLESFIKVVTFWRKELTDIIEDEEKNGVNFIERLEMFGRSFIRC